MKRSRKLALTSLMAAGGVSLTACGDGGNYWSNVQIDKPGKSTDAYAYTSLQECLDKNEVPDDACQTAQKAALADEKTVANQPDQKSCEDVYGEGQCVPRQQASGGSFWGPLITGFIVGRALDGGGWGGRGYYRDWRSGGYYTAGGRRIETDYMTGRTRVSARAFDPPDVVRPERVRTRSSVISRGGFGGRMSSSGGRRGGFGG